MKAWAVGHDGKFGYEVFELELPYSIVERYCIKRHPPDIMLGAVSRVQVGVTQVAQTPVGHYQPRPDSDPSREGGPLE